MPTRSPLLRIHDMLESRERRFAGPQESIGGHESLANGMNIAAGKSPLRAYQAGRHRSRCCRPNEKFLHQFR
jgi:hypothetical protein